MEDKTRSLDRTSIYRYKLDRLLGEGGTGIVYRGRDVKTGEVVAVKVFRSNFFRNALHKRDLAKTVKKFRKLSHQNLVKIYEFLDGKEGQCLVMEYVDGPNLNWYIKNRPWNLQERLVIVVQICNGLQFLHDHGFVHHDFKPANVIFSRKGVAKVADFALWGSSVLLSLIDRDAAYSQITPMYIAPEMILKEKATTQSDMYSLGVTMFIMFANRLPFETDNLQRLYMMHLRSVPEHPTFYNPNCPRDLGDIIMRLIDKKPENRYENFDQLRIALADIGRTRI
jgi:eukaryotic-like serine/threonine-protein kinase